MPLHQLRLLSLLRVAAACLLLLAGLIPAQGFAREVRVGVLALRGADMALSMWSPTMDYLESKLPGHAFRLIPLGFNEIELAVRERRADFVLANPTFYVQLEANYGVSPVVTMVNRHGDDKGYGVFGGVLFTRSDHAEIRHLGDLRGRTFAAVDTESFGGWHAGWYEMLRHGVDPERDLTRLEFMGTHDAVVQAVLDGKVDAGTVRTETIERMTREGKLDPRRLFILAARHTERFPLLHSTDLYPEWPLARVQGGADALAVEVAVALMRMSPDDAAARAGQIFGWTLPLNYQSVHKTLRELRIGPYEHLRHLSMREVMAQYWHWFAIALLALLLALSLVAYIGRTNQGLRLHQSELRRLNASLEQRVQERTERVELLLERERFLRVIVEMVADVNEILITAHSHEEMLKACCDRLVAHADYRFAWVGLLSGDALKLAAKSYGTAEFVRMMERCGEDGPGMRALRENRSVTLAIGPTEISSVTGECAVCSLPLRKDAFSQPIGVLCVFTIRRGGFDREEIAMLEQLAGDMGFATAAFGQRDETDRLQHERINHYEKTILSLVDLIERRDTYTAGHTRRVAHYCGLIAAQLEMPEAEVERLKQAAILHDIGKIAIPDSVLLKPDRLNALEYELIKQHVNVGYETLKRIDMYRDLAEIMRHHHERYDGSGYPQGLSHRDIPLSSAIMAVADAFDAMTTNRIYRPRVAVVDAIDEIESLAGRHYDPQVTRVVRDALLSVEPPEIEEQLPKSALERQRFAYFFTDQLTGAQNDNYLRFAFQHHMLDTMTCCCSVMLRGFGAYNERQGWAAGNALLAGFATVLNQLCPDAIAFRVGGDDFMLLSERPVVLDEAALAAHPVLENSGVRPEVRSFELDQAGREMLRAYL